MTPTGRHVRGFEESSWKATDDLHDTSLKSKDDTRSEEFNRNTDERKSKTKRVKNYLKRCKDALSGSSKQQNETKNEQNCSYWYVDNETRVTEHRISINDISENDQHSDSIDNSNKIDNVENIFVETENESKSLNDGEEVFEKIGPNYNHNTDVDTDTDINDECLEIGEGKEDGSLPQINEDLSDDTQDQDKPISDVDILFGNEVSHDLNISRKFRKKLISKIIFFC